MGLLRTIMNALSDAWAAALNMTIINQCMRKKKVVILLTSAGRIFVDRVNTRPGSDGGAR